MRAVLASAELADAALVDVKTDGLELLRERNGERQPDIAQTDDDDTRSPSHGLDIPS